MRKDICCNFCNKYLSPSLQPSLQPSNECINKSANCYIDMDFNIETNKINCCNSYKKALSMIEQTLPSIPNITNPPKDDNYCSNYNKNYCNYNIIKDRCPILCSK